MQSTKLLIAALALTLSTAAFASCGNGNVEESGSTTPGSTTESVTTETASREETTENGSGTQSGTGTESGSGTQGTTGSTGTTGTPGNGSSNATEGTTESETSGTQGTTGTTNNESSTTAPESGSIVDSVGEDARRGANNVKEGVEDFFGMGTGEKDGMKHRSRVPYGK